MPVYEYECAVCDGVKVEIERRMSEDEVLPVCSICNQDMRRVYFAAPIRFNGGGFYSTGG